MKKKQETKKMEVPTMADVCNCVAGTETLIKLFGASAEFSKSFYGLCSALGEVIAEEQGISMEQAKKLLRDTRLGEKAQRKFLELQSWIQKNK